MYINILFEETADNFNDLSKNTENKEQKSNEYPKVNEFVWKEIKLR